MSIKNIVDELSVSQIKWSMRRLYWGLPRKFLVLEIGSGGNPCPRSDILVDYSNSEHEQSRMLMSDRPTFLCAGESLPFSDNQFDYVISFHNLEHSSNPRSFLDEMQRVGKAGYIEVPSSSHEVLFPYRFHVSQIWKYKEKLFINMKKYWDEPLSMNYKKEMMANLIDNKKFIKFYRRNPSVFNIRYFWKSNISYEVLNENCDQSWDNTEEYSIYKHQAIGFSPKAMIRKFLPNLIRVIMGYSKRQVNIADILKCVVCSGNEFKKEENNNIVRFECVECGSTINTNNNLLYSDDFKVL